MPIVIFSSFFDEILWHDTTNNTDILEEEEKLIIGDSLKCKLCHKRSHTICMRSWRLAKQKIFYQGSAHYHDEGYIFFILALSDNN